MNLHQTDKNYLMRGEEPEDLEVVRSEGNYLIDAKGKKGLLLASTEKGFTAFSALNIDKNTAKKGFGYFRKMFMSF